MTEQIVKEKLEKLLYCCNGLHCDYSDMNYGDAKKWLRHIDIAYSAWQDAVDELEESNYDNKNNQR